MIRFLTIAVCLCALATGLLMVASRFTITLTIRPVSDSTITEPAREPAQTDAPKSAPKAKVGASKVDSHHTKGA